MDDNQGINDHVGTHGEVDIGKADQLNRQDVRLSTIVDLAPYDDRFAQFSQESRQLTVRETLGVDLPRRPAASRPRDHWWQNRRNLFIGVGVYAAITALAFPLSRLVGELLVVLPIFVGLAILIWKLSRPSAPPPVLIRGIEAVNVETFELRIIAHARNQIAQIMKARAWGSDEIQDKNAVLDLGLVLDTLTRRSLELYEFVAAADPKPDTTDHALFAQWESERQRVLAARQALLRQLGSLIEYREQIERVSRLMDQRDQANNFQQRSVRLQQLEAEAAADTGVSTGVEAAIHERRTVEANLAAQINFLAEVAAVQTAGNDR